MHALIPILNGSITLPQDDNNNTTDTIITMSNNNDTSTAEKKKLQALEAKAVAEATASADAAYTPSATLMNATSAELLLKQVDGPSLADYFDPDSTAGKESVYVGRSVPIAAGGHLTIPIQVSSPGSVVEYSVGNKQYDFGFSITAERDEGVTIVKVSDCLHYLFGCLLDESDVMHWHWSSCYISLVLWSYVSSSCLLSR